MPENSNVNTPSPPTPMVSEIFNYYYEDLLKIRVHKYYGNKDAPEKIRSLVAEFREKITDPQQENIQEPLKDIQDGGKVFYIGDTHGSLADTHKIIQYLVKVIEKTEENYPNHPEKYLKIIFVGDYVDRNDMDIHNLLYILSFTLQYSKFVRLLRGNHEEFTMNRNYGFQKNLTRNFGKSPLYEEILGMFIQLPLIHYLEFKNKRIMGVHAGIPFTPHPGQTPQSMPVIPNFTDKKDKWDSLHSRVQEMDTLAQQMLWNDPVDHVPQKNYYAKSRRGIGFIFGEKVFNEWISTNKVDRVIRGHEVFLEGHREFFNKRFFSLFSSSYYSRRSIEAQILEFNLEKPWDRNWTHYNIRKDL